MNLYALIWMQILADITGTRVTVRQGSSALLMV